MIPRTAIVLMVLVFLSANRSNGADFASLNADIEFGRQIRFSAQVRSEEPLIRASVTVRMNDGANVIVPAYLDAQGDFTLSAVWDLQAGPVFPFAHADYFWEVEDAKGRKTASEPQTLEYSDNRFAWQGLERGKTAVYWVEGNAEDAGNAADLVLLTLGSVSADLDLPIPDLVRVYIYPQLEDLRSGLTGSIWGWEGAVADPRSAVILVAAAPGADGRRTLSILLPHEVVHILLGTKYPPSAAPLPAWLVEGLAATYEMEPRPELDRSLAVAIAEEDFLPLSALCAAFPSEEAPALLAYAESRSFVGFVRRGFGRDAIRLALDAYAAGAACPDGFLASTGKTLEEMETLWRTELTGTGSAAVPVAGLLAGGAGVLGVILLGGWIIQRRNTQRAAGNNHD